VKLFDLGGCCIWGTRSHLKSWSHSCTKYLWFAQTNGVIFLRWLHVGTLKKFGLFHSTKYLSDHIVSITLCTIFSSTHQPLFKLSAFGEISLV
jgi:hypothetical protein